MLRWQREKKRKSHTMSLRTRHAVNENAVIKTEMERCRLMLRYTQSGNNNKREKSQYFISERCKCRLLCTFYDCYYFVLWHVSIKWSNSSFIPAHQMHIENCTVKLCQANPTRFESNKADLSRTESKRAKYIFFCLTDA